jgi:uncharacterized protein (DUF2267 family)
MATDVDTIDKTVQVTVAWLKEIQERLEVSDRKIAYKALRATLHAVRDRIGPDHAVHFAAQLPLLIKGIYYEGWRPNVGSSHERRKGPFFEHIRQEVTGVLEVGPEAAARAVFEVIRNRIDPGEVAKLRQLFPQDLRELWPAAVQP